MVGVSIIFDLLYLIMVREWETPVYMLVRSLVDQKEVLPEEAERVLDLISRKIKENKYVCCIYANISYVSITIMI